MPETKPPTIDEKISEDFLYFLSFFKESFDTLKRDSQKEICKVIFLLRLLVYKMKIYCIRNNFQRNGWKNWSLDRTKVQRKDSSEIYTYHSLCSASMRKTSNRLSTHRPKMDRLYKTNIFWMSWPNQQWR